MDLDPFGIWPQLSDPAPDPFSKWTQLSDTDPVDPFATLDITNLARYPKAYLMVANAN